VPLAVFAPQQKKPLLFDHLIGEGEHIGRLQASGPLDETYVGHVCNQRDGQARDSLA